MNFVEARLLGVRIDEAGSGASLEIIDKAKTRYTIQLDGVERLVVTEFREQNVIEQLTHWTTATVGESLREGAFYLVSGGREENCDPKLAAVATKFVDRVRGGDVQMLEITAIFGAQVLAAFAAMTIRSVDVR